MKINNLIIAMIVTIPSICLSEEQKEIEKDENTPLKYCLTQEKVGDLNSYINETPTKYGLPILSFLKSNLEIQESSQEKK